MIKIGLVLSGGMAKGAFQIGALKAIKEFFKKEDIFDETVALSSSSIGVLNAFSFAIDNIELGRDLWLNLMQGEKKLYISSVLKGDYLQKAIEKLAKESKKIEKPFFLTIYYPNEKELKYVDFSKEPVEDYRKYLQASVALPITNKPIELKGKKLFDGAVIDNIPISPFENLNLDLIICLYFDNSDYIFENPELDSKIIRIAFKNDSLLKDSICFEQKRIEEMIEEGYSFTKNKLEYYFSDKNMDSIKEKIKIENEKSNKREHRITGDFIVTKLNKLAKKFIKA